MKNTCSLVYFSPTASTRMILERIAEGLEAQVDIVLDITPSKNRAQEPPQFTKGPVLIGAPVYGGRLPRDAVQYFNTMKAAGVPAVAVVLYGNREYEDALLELKNICKDRGFITVAGAAFIGEHSFSSSRIPIASNRPDESDLKKAFAFGRRIAGLLDQIPEHGVPELEVPGNFPYKAGMAANPADFIDVLEDCDACGICAAVCPKDAIDEDDYFSTDNESCIHCCACIKSCPRSARVMADGPFKDISKWLYDNYSTRKEPETFVLQI